MKSARERWFERLHAERDRRRDAELMVDGRNPRELLLEQLSVMGARLRSDPNFVEPGEAEDRLLERWFKQHGYDIKLGG
jgi:hypothetical protein